jgi:hypothetical protein
MDNGGHLNRGKQSTGRGVEKTGEGGLETLGSPENKKMNKSKMFQLSCGV